MQQQGLRHSFGPFSYRENSLSSRMPYRGYARYGYPRNSFDANQYGVPAVRGQNAVTWNRMFHGGRNDNYLLGQHMQSYPQWSRGDVIDTSVPPPNMEVAGVRSDSFRTDTTVISSRNETETSQVSKDMELVPNPRTSLIRTTIVHFSGGTHSPRYSDPNMDIYCNEGSVKANVDIMAMASSYFHAKSKLCRNLVMMPNMEKGMMFLIVELVTKGRVCVLLTRLRKLLELVSLLGIRGVFSTEPPDDDLMSVSDNTSCQIEYLDFFSAVGKDGGTVRCNGCNNSMVSSVFINHYQAYHDQLMVPITCCNSLFYTNYEYQCHARHLKSSGIQYHY